MLKVALIRTVVAITQFQWIDLSNLAISLYVFGVVSIRGQC